MVLANLHQRLIGQGVIKSHYHNMLSDVVYCKLFIEADIRLQNNFNIRALCWSRRKFVIEIGAILRILFVM